MDQFDKAQKECAKPAKLATWLPILQQYGPDLIVLCEGALEMSKRLVETWLAQYMFRGLDDAKQKAQSVSRWLADQRQFKSHGRHISREDLKRKGLVIDDLESDKKLEDLSLSVFHSTTHTFGGAAVKIVENHTGRAFIKNHHLQAMPIPNFPVLSR